MAVDRTPSSAAAAPRIASSDFAKTSPDSNVSIGGRENMSLRIFAATSTSLTVDNTRDGIMLPMYYAITGEYEFSESFCQTGHRDCPIVFVLAAGWRLPSRCETEGGKYSTDDDGEIQPGSKHQPEHDIRFQSCCALRDEIFVFVLLRLVLYFYYSPPSTVLLFHMV